ncbi:Type I Iterative PKS [Sporothrix bragantina]|uniref:Type I Iterative PKS n=1 Tax=Sporothrix bragantina TaxID=671064 RepID=A0ABP0B1H1_9PEZI
MPYKPAPSEPIAVVASSCRFAGGATSPSKLWDLLKQPSDVSRPVPPSRFNIRAFHHPEGDYHGTTDAPKSYWLDDDQDVREFDAGFFGIAPKEAEAVDPQQRLLLETVYEALESAGFQLPQWAGKDVAVYVGAMTADFDSISQRDDLTTSPYYATGNARSILSNRISYFYDFRGPSVTMDTACSSSLVALHQAVLSLRAGDCSAACVAGVNLMLSPEQFVVESSLHMLSPTGHCHMWDSRADGYARGEGTAVLFLKPLSRALADGDGSRIQAIIRETGVGSDGRTAGITMPSPEAQASLIRATYRRSGLDITDPADRCQYFEAHGTGTPVGDPRESKAIYTAFFGDRKEDVADEASPSDIPPPMLVGSVKTVIGHTEGAAGLAGLMKVILAMKQSKVPPNLHMERLNPQVAPFCTPTAQGYLRIPTELMSWPQVAPGQPLRASVNSFGFGGTNAHAIVEHYDPCIHSPKHAVNGQPITAVSKTSTLPQIPLMLSACSASTLRVLAKNYLDFLQHQQDNGSEADIQEVAWRTYMSKTQFLHRLAVSGQSRAEAIGILSDLVSDATQSQAKDFGLRARRVENKSDGSAPRILGVFTGQGAQWPGMSKGLFLTNPIYRESIRYLDSVLKTCPDPPQWILEEEMLKTEADGSRLREAAIAQPVCTALQIGLVDILRQLGFQFSCVIGHSSGEIAAAYAAKYISARDAILIAYYRGKSISSPTTAQGEQQKQQTGGMLAAGMSYADAFEFCQSFDGRLCAAASNSPSSSTLSGDIDAVEEAEQQLKAKSVFVRRILVDKAYHSHHMARLAGSYQKALASCQLLPPARLSDTGFQTRWISSVGPVRQLPSSEQLAGSYWVDNMVNPVLFREAAEEALSTVQGEFDCVVEVGPHFTLKGPFADTVAQFHTKTNFNAKSLLYTSLLQRGKNDATSFLEFLGFAMSRFDPPLLNLQGLLDTDGKAQLADSLSRLHSQDIDNLPSYPWDHSQKYYRESRITRQFHHKTEAPHELLGSRTRDDVEDHELRWRNLLRVDKLPWLAHHSFQGQPLLPASAYCIMALDATKALLAGREASVIELQDVDFISGIPLEVEGPATEVMFSLFVEQQPGKTPAAASESEVDGNDTIRCSFSLYSGPETSSTPLRKRCSGRIRIVLDSPRTDALPSRVHPSKQPEAFNVSTESFYGMMSDVGLQYSGPFKAIESMRRRHNFASATLKRTHQEDTTGLAFSPATLDSCLQTCFASYSSPGDKALWTVFLPIRMKKVSFNMAKSGVSGATDSSRSTDLSVDAQLVNVQEATPDSPARITSDVSIFNEDGDMEIFIEGLTVGSLASSHPDADRDLYLHTTFAPDPEVALVQDCTILSDNDAADMISDEVLEESIQRVQAFYSSSHGSSATWPTETEVSLDQHILSSPYSFILDNVRTYLRDSASDHTSVIVASDNLQPVQSLLEEGRHALQFKRQATSIIKQIAHKYPHMSVLSLTDSLMGMSNPILKGLGSAFTSYTSVVLGAPDKIFDVSLSQSSTAVKGKVHRFNLAQFDDVKTQLDEVTTTASQPFDLAILSTSIFKQSASSEDVLDKVKSLMRPGGFLILVDMPIKMTRDRDQQSVNAAEPIITPPDWPDLLDQHGFMNPAIQNTDQHYPGGFSITVRQSESLLKKNASRLPSSLSFDVPEIARLKDRVLIVGGQTPATSLLTAQISQLLSSHFYSLVETFASLDDLAKVNPETLSTFNCTILLSDLDDSNPILSSLDERRLESLRKLVLRPGSTMLWVTKGSHAGNAENAASYGFTRSIRAEMPSLILQMLDFDHLNTVNGQLVAPCEPSTTPTSAAAIVANTFLQLMLASDEKRGQTQRSALNSSEDEQHIDHLWTLENELFVDNTGQRLISRMLPFKPGNDNFNSLRRVVTQRVNTLSSRVELVHDTARNTYQALPIPSSVSSIPTSNTSPIVDACEQATIQVHYSSTVPLFKGLYVVIGQCIETGNIVLSASKANFSIVSVPHEQLVTISTSDDSRYSSDARTYAAALIRVFMCLSLELAFDNKQLVLVAPDDMLQRCAQHFTLLGRSIAVIQVADGTQKEDSVLSIHPRDSASQMAAKLTRFGDGAAVVSFLPKDHAISRRLSSTVMSGYTYHSWDDLITDMGQYPEEIHSFNIARLRVALSTARRVLSTNPGHGSSDNFVSVPSLLDWHGSVSSSLKIVDWRAERVVDCRVHPHEGTKSGVQGRAGSATQLRGDRTYVLIGITRDMGQSLSTLLIKQGARHIVLASRSVVAVEPQWATHARSMLGVDVRFEVFDVTDLAAVEQFRLRVEQQMPRIGGIVNGAMVLNDQVFAQMKAETFSRVMRPKTVGSRNLDTVFHDDEEEADNKLDFFIMTSSFAAMGGHAGQSNYAAANMYMNGIAANRQRRGVAGSALNIGVVYGLGFLFREKEELYAGLEREGYPPISERDLHHMFLEAIAYGRPKADETARNRPLIDLTAGLSRFNPHQAPEDALHWHEDPRFSHFTIKDDEASGSGRSGGKDVGAGNSSLNQLLGAISDETAAVESIGPLLVAGLSERLATLLHLGSAAGSEDPTNSNGNGGQIRSDSSLMELGVDSLVAVEMRTWLWRTTGRDVPVMKILSSASIDKLCQEIAGEVVASRG